MAFDFFLNGILRKLQSKYLLQALNESWMNWKYNIKEHWHLTIGKILLLRPDQNEMKCVRITVWYYLQNLPFLRKKQQNSFLVEGGKFLTEKGNYCIRIAIFLAISCFLFILFPLSICDLWWHRLATSYEPMNGTKRTIGLQ